MNTGSYYSSRVKNNNPKSPIAYFRIVPVREHDGWNGNYYIDEIRDIEDFYLYKDIEVFYHIYGERYIDDKRSGRIFLGEFPTVDRASDFIYYLTGEVPDIISY